MTKKISWGIISTADINTILIPAIRKDQRCNILAIASRDKDKAELYAKQWDIPNYYGSYHELLEDNSINAIYISLPNGLHHEWCIKSARAGKHILCEKPLATTVKDCKEIIEVAKESHIFLQEGFMYRYHPQTMEVPKILQSNILGDIKYIYLVFSFSLEQAYGDDVNNLKNYRLNPNLGGGCLWDIGSYVVNFSRLLSGCEPDEVFGYSKEYKNFGVDGLYCGMLKFPNGIIAQFECSYFQPQRTYTEIVGSRGTLRIPYPYCLIWDGSEPIVINVDGDKKEIILDKVNAYEREVAHFCDCIIEGEPRLVALNDSINNIIVLNSLHESAQKGKSIKIIRE